jgi:ElaB/YqjD/DUF883 family membrane-anchored ribosome-binding protein
MLMARAAGRDEFAANAKAELAHARSAFNTMKDDLRDSGRKARHALESGMDAGATSMRRVARQSARAMDNARREISTSVREHPLAYTGGAIAAGLLLGMLLRGRRPRRF